VETALLSPASRVLLCGGEERGTWLLDHHISSERTFAFALALSLSSDQALARISVESVPTVSANATLTLPEFFDALVARRNLDTQARPGARLVLQWL
jgi:hypothetical protein